MAAAASSPEPTAKAEKEEELRDSLAEVAGGSNGAVAVKEEVVANSVGNPENGHGLVEEEASSTPPPAQPQAHDQTLTLALPEGEEEGCDVQALALRVLQEDLSHAPPAHPSGEASEDPVAGDLKSPSTPVEEALKLVQKTKEESPSSGKKLPTPSSSLSSSTKKKSPSSARRPPVVSQGKRESPTAVDDKQQPPPSMKGQEKPQQLKSAEKKTPPLALRKPASTTTPTAANSNPNRNLSSTMGVSPSSPRRASLGTAATAKMVANSPGSPARNPPSSLKLAATTPPSNEKRTPGKSGSKLLSELGKSSPLSPAANGSVAATEISGVSDTRSAQATAPPLVQHRVRELLKQRKPLVNSRPASVISSSIEKNPAAPNSFYALTDEEVGAAAGNPADLGPFLLKQAKSAIASGDNPYKALEYALRASKSFERSAAAAGGKPSLDLVTSLHILAAIHCSLGRFEDAVPVLRHSIEVIGMEEADGSSSSPEYALAAFGGHMQLGDTLALLGRSEEALEAYHAGLAVQKKSLGDMDPHVGATCRYIAEAHAQAMQFEKAQELCQHALDIHREHSAPASVEEATDRRLMGLICNGRGEHEAALEHLVLASMALIANAQEVEIAAVDASIGDTYTSLGRFDEAVFAYQKSLTVFKSARGEVHASVASVYVSLAELYLKTGKHREAKTYCESALRIYNKQGGVGGAGGSGGGGADEVASGLTEIAAVYQALNEQDQALPLLRKALSILEAAPGHQSAVAGVEAQIGVVHYVSGRFAEARASFESAVLKLKGSAEKSSSLLGIVLNQMGLSCAHLHRVVEAAGHFEEARSILEDTCGPCHLDTLAVYSNLAGAYDALGRLNDAIDVLEYVVEMREEKLGTANPEVDDERKRLEELLKEAGRSRAERSNKTLQLLMQSNAKQGNVRQQSPSLLKT